MGGQKVSRSHPAPSLAEAEITGLTVKHHLPVWPWPLSFQCQEALNMAHFNARTGVSVRNASIMLNQELFPSNYILP